MFEKGYIKVSNILDRETAKVFMASLLIAESQGKLEKDKQQVVGSTIVHGDPLCEALLLKLLPVMQNNTDLQLIPTYSFARIYRNGDKLEKHTDRPSCEISTTLTLGFIANDIWPIFANGANISLDVGEMLIYRGCEIEHWREPFPGELWVQVFLHYVDANGPHKEWALDKRNLQPLYETIYKEIIC
jgi:hypothetical protein